jgi:hypothetical protein
MGARPSAVTFPALVAGGMGLVLGTMGCWFVGFGIATSCTDVHESVHGYDAMYRWMHGGRTGQWVLALPVIAGWWWGWQADQRPSWMRNGAQVAVLDGDEDLEVVGESYYQPNLWRLAGASPGKRARARGYLRRAGRRICNSSPSSVSRRARCRSQRQRLACASVELVYDWQS